jgi:hypothetical protein
MGPRLAVSKEVRHGRIDTNELSLISGEDGLGG